MRTLLAGEAEGVCSDTGVGVRDSAGEIENSGDASVSARELGLAILARKQQRLRTPSESQSWLLCHVERSRGISN